MLTTDLLVQNNVTLLKPGCESETNSTVESGELSGNSYSGIRTCVYYQMRSQILCTQDSEAGK